MYNHNKAQQSKNRVHISWDILYQRYTARNLTAVVLFMHAFVTTILWYKDNTMDTFTLMAILIMAVDISWIHGPVFK